MYDIKNQVYLLSFALTTQVSSVTASSPRLSTVEFDSLLSGVERALANSTRPMDQEQAHALAAQLRTPSDSMAYCEFAVRRVVHALRMLPDFTKIDLPDRVKILKVSYDNDRRVVIRCI